MDSLIGNNTGIIDLNAHTDYHKDLNCRFVLSVHPALCIYRAGTGIKLLSESIKAFKNLEEKTQTTFDFLEDEDLWKI